MEQIIKLTGRIAKVFPTNSGVSQRTGNQWMSQEYLLEYFSWSGARYPDRVVFRIFGEDRIKQFNLQELEDNVTVILRMDAHENDGRWYNEISAINIMRANQPSQGANTQQAAQQPTAQQPIAGGGALGLSGQPSEAAPFPPQVDANGNTDDLPF